MRFGFIVFFHIWEPWDVCWFSSDFHKMSIANHLLAKWNWMLWLVTDLRKTSGSSIFLLCSKQVKSGLKKTKEKKQASIIFIRNFFSWNETSTIVFAFLLKEALTWATSSAAGELRSKSPPPEVKYDPGVKWC